MGRMEPLGSAVEPLMHAVDGAVWALYDEPHRRLYVGRDDASTGWTVHTYDIVTGELADQPWPVEPNTVALHGYAVAFRAAVTERIKQGYGNPPRR